MIDTPEATANVPANVPTLTELLQGPQRDTAALIRQRSSSSAMPTALFAAAPSLQPERSVLASGGVDLQRLEQRLFTELIAHFEQVIEKRVHASVGPAISLLADRIAYKAAQELSATLSETLRLDLQQAVHDAIQEAAGQGSAYGEAGGAVAGAGFDAHADR